MIWRYVLRRLLLLIPGVLLIVTLTFFIVRVLPGNPAYFLAGPRASPEDIALVEGRLGLDKALPVQYWNFLVDVSHADLGRSWISNRPVTDDLVDRLPATLELVTYSLLLSVILGIGLGVFLAIPGRSGLLAKIADRGVFGYSFLAGAIPDFWLSLILIFIFFTKLHLLPGPVGRIGLEFLPPDRVTGFYTIDSLLALDFDAFVSSVKHLVLPVATLVLILMGPILKMTRQTMSVVFGSDYMIYARSFGLGGRQVGTYALRSTLAPVLTLVAILYGYFLGGAVLVETIFSWGGAGQYAVQSVTSSDYAPVQGFVLMAATFALVIYLLLDIAIVMLDPRVKY